MCTEFCKQKQTNKNTIKKTCSLCSKTEICTEFSCKPCLCAGKNKLCAEFKDLETAVVQMALESCHYDEDKVRATLSRVTSQWQSSRYDVSMVGWIGLCVMGHRPTW